MNTSLLITTYNRTNALLLCLQSVLHQVVMPDEIVIADDGSTAETKLLIDAMRPFTSVPIVHVWHQDKGFRLSEIRNKGIYNANGKYIIQIDGDIILHSHFVKEHIRFAQEGCLVVGRRVSLLKEKTQKLIADKSIRVSWLSSGIKNRELGIHFPLYNSLIPIRKEDNSRSISGGNMAFWKKDFILVNGYNNELQGWGAEDKEFAQRLINAGVKKIKLRFAAIQYHLYHKEFDKSNHKNHRNVVEELTANKEFVCKSGLREIEQDFKIYNA